MTRKLVMHHVDRRAHVFALSGRMEVCVTRREGDIGDVVQSVDRERHMHRHRIAEKALERGQLLESVRLDLFVRLHLSERYRDHRVTFRVSGSRIGAYQLGLNG